MTPFLQAVQKSSPSIDRLGAWLNPGNIPQVNIRGRGFLELALENAPRFFSMLLIVHVLAFFLLLYGAQLLKKLVDMIPGVSEKQNVVEIAAEIEQTAARYFTSVTLINACVGVSVWISVGLLGLPIRCSGVWLHFCSIIFPSWEQRVESWRWRSFHSFILIRPGMPFCRLWRMSSRDDRGKPGDTVVSRALVDSQPDCYPADFSSLVLPLGITGTLLAVPLLATFKIFCDRIRPLRRVGSFLGSP